jgi:hypothetical protein
MDVRRLVLVFPCAILAAAWGGAQTAAELKLAGTVLVADRKADSITEPVKCDSQSNIYAQAGRGSERFSRVPIIKVSPDGEATVFPLPRLQGNTLDVLGFDPTAGSGVVMLTVDSDGHHYIETYDDGAEFESRFALPPELYPMQIAASSDGKVLVSGLYSTAAGPGAEKTARPFAGIFGRSGRLEREIEMAGDRLRNEDGTLREAGLGTGPNGKPDRYNLSGTSVQSSVDGNLIFSRLSSGGPIYVVSPAGFVLNQFDPPSIPGAKLRSVTVTPSGLAALYTEEKAGGAQGEISDVYISLLDAQSGEEQARFHHSSWELGASLACYGKGVFTFLTTDEDGRLELARAK